MRGPTTKTRRHRGGTEDWRTGRWHSLANRGSLLGASVGVSLTVALKLLHLAGVRRVPVADDLLLWPGEMVTWLFVLGDVGSPLEYYLWPLVLGCLLNGSVGLVVGLLLYRAREVPASREG